jgi:L-ascorbate metabolism protein UlaG (beta-lactamase superfamily)
MRIQWFGQSAFLLTADKRVAIDPFGELPPGRDMRFEYPPIEDVEADLLLVTHEHFDHTGVDSISGDPQVIRSTAGTLESPVGDVVGVASEHDDAAGTKRGPNTIFVFSMNGYRICHMGDFGQKALRPEQKRAIGKVDVLFLPVGGGPTISGPQAADLARELKPRMIVPMHFRTPAIDFLERPDAFMKSVTGKTERPGESEIDTDELIGTRKEPVVAVLEPPL